eukprot:g4085.t1
MSSTSKALVGKLGKRLKVLVIVGATAVGKTKLSVQLAKALNAEIVNGDALQVYKGLDIATAKVTEEERCGVPHHLFSFVEPHETISVREYRDKALRTIEDIASRGRLPIVVGGTTYYIQSLIWSSLIDEETTLAGAAVSMGKKGKALAVSSCRDSGVGPATTEINRTASSGVDRSSKIATSEESLFEELKRVDPQMAERLHPKDVRKIENSLTIFKETGIQHSQLIAKQHSRDAAMQPRFDCRAIWLDCDDDSVFEDRLSARIVSMVSDGLLDEVSGVWEKLRETIGEEHISPQDGLVQAIGFKEFLPWLQLPKPRPIAPYSLRSFRAGGSAKQGRVSNRDRKRAKRGGVEIPEVDEGKEILGDCLDTLRLRTRQFSKRQRKWIRNRFACRNIHVTRLDTSDVSMWDELVFEPALTVTKKLVAGEKIPDEEQKCMDERNRKFWDSRDISKWKKYACDVCGVIANGSTEWQKHMASAKHRRATQRAARRLAARGGCGTERGTSALKRPLGLDTDKP